MADILFPRVGREHATVGFGLGVKREVQEKVLRAIGIGHEANQVILPGKCAGGSDAGAGIWLGEITAGGALRRPKRSNWC